jgi:hypothetical protein
MEEEIDRLVIAVRADTQGFARDLGDMRAALDGPFGRGMEQAGRTLEASLSRALRTGKLGVEDLKRAILSVMADIAASSIRSGMGAIMGSQSGSSGLVSLATTLASTLLGLPGRATGGPVSPGRGYLVGERGPEIFVPTSSGSIVPPPGGMAPPRDVRVSIAIHGPASEAPDLLARSSRQVARAVRTALLNAG